VKIDEFLLGIIKMTRCSQSIDMISIDFNQRKTMRDIMTVKRVYEQDERLMCHYMIRVDDFLSNIGEQVQSLSEEMTQDMEKLGDVDSLLTKKEDPDSGPTADLEARFNFMTRLAALKADVKDLSSKAKKEGLAGLMASQKSSSSNHPVSSSLIQQASLSNAKVGDAWRTIMQEDVLPWLRRELAQITQKKAIQESPAVQIPHSHNMPSYGQPDKKRKIPLQRLWSILVVIDAESHRPQQPLVQWTCTCIEAVNCSTGPKDHKVWRHLAYRQLS